jgi:hypothetical protein
MSAEINDNKQHITSSAVKAILEIVYQRTKDKLDASAFSSVSGTFATTGDLQNYVETANFTNSGNWNSSYETLTANSGSWDSTSATVNSNSGTWGAFSAASGDFATTAQLEDKEDKINYGYITIG